MNSSKQVSPNIADNETSMLLNENTKSEPNLSFTKVTKDIFAYALMPIIGMIFHPVYSVVNAAVVGRFENANYLAALGLGSLTVGIMVISICTSFALVLTSFVAPAHGDNDARLARVYLHRQWYLNTLVFCVAIIPIFFIYDIFIAIGQDAQIAALATQYVQWVTPGVYCHIQATAIIGYCQGQKYTTISLFTLSISSMFHIFFVYLFVAKMDMGWTGICIATACHFLLRFIVAYIYLQFVKPYRETSNVSLFSKESCTNVGNQFERGLYSLFMGVWGWWAFDIFTLMCSYLAPEIISAQTIMRSLGLLTFMIPVGFNNACSYFMGLYIGKGCSQSVIYYYKVCLKLSLLVGIITAILLVIFEQQMLDFYTNQAIVQEQMNKAWPIFVVFVVFDTTQGVGSSAIRATGLQKTGSLITGLAYWALGIPLSCALVFWQTWGIFGIWVGPTAAVIFNTLAYMILVKNMDFEEIIVKQAGERNEDRNAKAEKEDDQFKNANKME